jgi:hypothetical protein
LTRRPHELDANALEADVAGRAIADRVRVLRSPSERKKQAATRTETQPGNQQRTRRHRRHGAEPWDSRARRAAAGIGTRLVGRFRPRAKYDWVIDLDVQKFFDRR